MTDPIAEAIADTYKTYLTAYVGTINKALLAIPRVLVDVIVGYSATDSHSFHELTCTYYIEHYIGNRALMIMQIGHIRVQLYAISHAYSVNVNNDDYMAAIRTVCARYSYELTETIAYDLAGSYWRAAQKVIQHLLYT